MAINCTCDDTTGYRTLAQLRTGLFDRLGFADPMANVATRALSDLRNDLLIRLGNAALVGATLPPGMQNLLDSLINEAQQTLFRRLELDKGAVSLPARLTLDADVTTLDYVPVLNLATAMGLAHYGKTNAKAYFDMVEQYLADTIRRRPPNATALCTGFLQDAQRQIIRRYPALRMDRWFSWSLVEGERFYDLPDNDEQAEGADQCTKELDPLAIKWVGVTQGTTRYALRRGIPPQVLDYDTTSSWPSCYEIKQCIELWPAPAATEGTLRIRAGFKATAFAADADLPSIDDELVFLLALANAKAHFKQADAGDIVRQFEIHLQGIVAGGHGGMRYVPGERRGDLVYVEPKPSVPFA